MGSGNEASGEGWRLSRPWPDPADRQGQLSGSRRGLGVDLVSSPDQVAAPEYAALTAGWFWDSHKLNALADKRDNTGITRAINGGTLGLDDRVARNKALAVLKG